MTTLVSPQQAQTTEIDPTELRVAVTQQVADILEGAEPEPQTREKEPTHWSYTVPFAGVRYYYF